VCRQGRFGLVTLERLDAVALVGACTAWAFFIEPPLVESIQAAVVSVAMTMLARSIMVPSKATRTLRLAVLAVLPVTALMWLSLGQFTASGPATLGAPAVAMTAVFQMLLVIAVIWMAGITSRTLHDLRQSMDLQARRSDPSHGDQRCPTGQAHPNARASNQGQRLSR
jgi:hypothetical protein